ncbi:PREDICTED: leukotriene A-4 hydrolase-like [Cyphomyrmex costatus]|uniref:leukotriene A-4 hydrolase-like n=1 Tax=Cyphomyrmex costatus TaxID=456900 RepID=UPI00085224AF|nr:PREDICTED: leukotriene A-4 hydrolase-like [Cyphomyrmex costatus]
MDSLTSNDPYSCVKPDDAKVVHTDLDLFIDFDETVIHGKAVLFIKSKADCDRIEDKITVKDDVTGNALVYKINKCIDNIGSEAFLIMLPRTLRNDEKLHDYKDTLDKIHFLYNYRILIEYKTRKDSLALYWLRRDQTSDGTHPFLLTNNQFTYARGIFPCQDSPQVRFTYTAEISVPKAIRVIVGGRRCKSIIKGNPDRYTHLFYETNPMPSYAIIIVAGLLRLHNFNRSKIVTLWAEEKHFEQSTRVLNFCKHAIDIANELCGFPIQEEYNICVLPSNIPEIELQCRTMIFVSSTLLDEDPVFMYNTIARKIAQSWAGGLVTCKNFQHLWLIKGFSIFISSEILQSKYLPETDEITFMRRRIFTDLSVKMRLYGVDSQQKLVPSLTDILPKNISKSVPDEVGYYLLDSLRNDLGGSTVFAQYLKHYMRTFCYQSIDTIDYDWMVNLFSYFDSKHEISVPKTIKVIVGGLQSKSTMKYSEDRDSHFFYETNPMPSYTIIIMAGSLKSIDDNYFSSLISNLKITL